jgi:uracil-DNA glycosylase
MQEASRTTDPMMQIDLFDKTFNEIMSAASYADFKARLEAYDCRRCTLCHSRSNIVVDRGNPRASIMIISERPGDNEDRIGKPFVGRAGELLDKMLVVGRRFARKLTPVFRLCRNRSI